MVISPFVSVALLSSPPPILVVTQNRGHYGSTVLVDMLHSEPLLPPCDAPIGQVEGAADSLSCASAHHTATAALTESLNNGADSPLSLWVFKLSKRLHIGKINSIRGTRGDLFFFFAFLSMPLGAASRGALRRPLSILLVQLCSYECSEI